MPDSTRALLETLASLELELGPEEALELLELVAEVATELRRLYVASGELPPLEVPLAL